MKIVEKKIQRVIPVSTATVLWNYLDFEHLSVVHKNYTNAEFIYEDEHVVLEMLSFKIPFFSFLHSNSLHFFVKKSPQELVAFNLGLFGIPSITRIQIHELEQQQSEITVTHRFILRGWTQLLAPLFPKMIERWNKQVWNEDLPLKLRRQQMLNWGFRDFIGLPSTLEERYGQPTATSEGSSKEPSKAPPHASSLRLESTILRKERQLLAKFFSHWD